MPGPLSEHVPMPDLLLEFFSEEIPARMQARAAEDLKKLVTDKLVDAGLTYEGAKAFATPRRLTLTVAGIPVRQPDVKEERKGPRVDANEKAISGFLKAAGLSSIDQAKIEKDPKKGDFYVAVIEKAGRPAIEVIGELVPEVAKSFPWPKSMRWGSPDFVVDSEGNYITTDDGKYVYAGDWLKWIRPLHSILATFGPETEEPDVIEFEVDGVRSGNETRGHRFMAPAPIKVKRLDDYVAKLEAAKVVVDPARRADMILADAKNLAFAQGFELIEDQGLLAEVAGLVEWPVVLMGSFDEAFLAIPEEVIRATIRNNQKCFVVRDPNTAKLANKFILVSNIEASDGGKAIVAGCERVIRARLSDAKFFYETDLRTRLEDRLLRFEHIVFHEKLGTQAERIARIQALAGHLAPIVGADVAKAERAAWLAKADLLTEVVGEFPEVQGLMGRYYAQAQGEDEAIAHAIEDHYKPKGPDDLVPSDPVSIAVALADKIDILTGFWAIDEKPTGSKDPYALRRAALGVIRLVLDNSLRLRLIPLFEVTIEALFRRFDFGIVDDEFYKTDVAGGPAASRFVEYIEKVEAAVQSTPWGGIFDRHLDFDTAKRKFTGGEFELNYSSPQLREFVSEVQLLFGHMLNIAENEPKDIEAGDIVSWRESKAESINFLKRETADIRLDLLSFFADRLKVQLREQGARHDLVDAVFSLEGQDDLVLIVRRIEALAKFLDTEDGKNLLAGTKRAANILRIEERKDKLQYTEPPDPGLLQQAEEQELAKAINNAKLEADIAIAREDFAAAMTAMAKLRPYVDAFFDKVTVNVDDVVLRANRLRLLNEIRKATRAVADFSKIEG